MLSSSFFPNIFVFVPYFRLSQLLPIELCNRSGLVAIACYRFHCFGLYPRLLPVSIVKNYDFCNHEIYVVISWEPLFSPINKNTLNFFLAYLLVLFCLKNSPLIRKICEIKFQLIFFVSKLRFLDKNRLLSCRLSSLDPKPVAAHLRSASGQPLPAEKTTQDSEWDLDFHFK